MKTEFYAAARRALYWVREFRRNGDSKMAEKAWQAFMRERDFARKAV